MILNNNLKISKTSGIYRIRNIINSKVYIGSAVNIYNRYCEHLGDLNSNKHHSKRLQNSWNKHKEENFEFDILELCSKESLIEKEQYYIDMYQSFDKTKGYNICKIAGNSLNYKHTTESIEKMREFGKKKVINPKAIEAMQKANIGKKKPEAAKLMSKIFSKPVIQLSLHGEFIAEWTSMTNANISLNIPKGDSNISKCTNGKCKSARGFIWVKKEDYDSKKKYGYSNERGKKNSISVFQYSLNGEFIKRWNSGNQAAKSLNIDLQGIYCCIWGKYKTAGGYKWYKKLQDEYSS